MAGDGGSAEGGVEAQQGKGRGRRGRGFRRAGVVGWEGIMSTRGKPASALGRDVPGADRVSVCAEILSAVWETWLWGQLAGE